MAIAIKRELAQTRYAELSRRFAGEGRTGIKLTCPQGGCRQEYVLYFGLAGEEEEMGALFDQRVGQHHPCHLDLYAFEEPLPHGSEQPGLQGESSVLTPLDQLRTIRRKMRLRPAVAQNLVQPTMHSGLLARTSRKCAGYVAFLVAAVPMAARSLALFGPK